MNFTIYYVYEIFLQNFIEIFRILWKKPIDLKFKDDLKFTDTIYVYSFQFFFNASVDE